jgi:hypothetical protein
MTRWPWGRTIEDKAANLDRLSEKAWRRVSNVVHDLVRVTVDGSRYRLTCPHWSDTTRPFGMILKREQRLNSILIDKRKEVEVILRKWYREVRERIDGGCHY